MDNTDDVDENAWRPWEVEIRQNKFSFMQSADLIVPQECIDYLLVHSQFIGNFMIMWFQF